MHEMDPWGQGILTCSDVEKYITDFTSITAMKMKENKLVKYALSIYARWLLRRGG
jgi:hypothetical protein